MTIDLKNALVCVSGAARGIGKETARALAARGAEVWIGDIDIALAEETARELGVHAHELDVTDPTSFEDFLAAPGRAVSMLVNNAGVMHVGRFVDLDLDAHIREIQVDLTGVVIGMRLALPDMIARNHGHIVNVASMAGIMTVAGVATYNATKFGVVALSRAVRAEISHTGVTISTVMPSVVRTELTAGISTRGIPASDPSDIATVIIDSAHHGRREITVPRWAAGIGIAEAAVPESILTSAKRLIGSGRLLTDIDTDARMAYDSRA